MCKIAILTGISDSTKALEFMIAAQPEMTLHNSDGIGYAAVNSKNEMFMEKWHKNADFLKERTLNVDYMNYGNITRDDLKTVTMHTRFATCGREMENTHPFVYQDTSLIHNGVIYNDRQLNNKKISTCDSESALQLYLKKELAHNTKSVYQAFLDELEGYWAFGILARAKAGNFTLDVIKGGARLYVAYLPELGENCIVFATTPEIIVSACKTLGYNIPTIEDLKDNTLTKFDAVTGKLLANAEFKSKYTKFHQNYASEFGDDMDEEFTEMFLNAMRRG